MSRHDPYQLQHLTRRATTLDHNAPQWLPAALQPWPAHDAEPQHAPPQPLTDQRQYQHAHYPQQPPTEYSLQRVEPHQQQGWQQQFVTVRDPHTGQHSAVSSHLFPQHSSQQAQAAGPQQLYQYSSANGRPPQPSQVANPYATHHNTRHAIPDPHAAANGKRRFTDAPPPPPHSLMSHPAAPFAHQRPPLPPSAPTSAIQQQWQHPQLNNGQSTAHHAQAGGGEHGRQHTGQAQIHNSATPCDPHDPYAQYRHSTDVRVQQAIYRPDAQAHSQQQQQHQQQHQHAPVQQASQQPSLQAQNQHRQQQAPAQQANQQHSSQQYQPSARIYAQLSKNIVQRVRQLSPSQQEQRDKEKVLAVVTDTIRKAFSEYAGVTVEPFGSYVSGLGTRNSDIDVVVVGLAEPTPGSGFYERHQRAAIGRLLDKIVQQMRKHRALGIQKLLVIRHCRIPIIKLVTHEKVCVDVSISNRGGPIAAHYMRSQVAQFPALRPLVLILKSYLAVEGLNEVSTGGLSSYGLTYMVIAHLMEEEKVGRDTSDLGLMLHRFLRRYSSQFDVGSMAVSVQDGGLVPRSKLGIHAKDMSRITVKDPLTGRDCTEGAFRSSEVLAAFERADKYLTSVIKKHAPPAAAAAAAADNSSASGNSNRASHAGASAADDLDLLEPLLMAGPDQDEAAEEEDDYMQYDVGNADGGLAVDNGNGRQGLGYYPVRHTYGAGLGITKRQKSGEAAAK